MRLLLLLAAILVAGVFTEAHEEESETSLCVEHQDPFAYSHCIKKRDIGCQNSGFCGTCNGNSCQTCEGNSCKTSCNGAGCNQCPNGNCCNGQNCNVCSGRNCCSSSSCNGCVNKCNSGCSTPSCRSTCQSDCQTNSCCDRTECFNSCRNQCFGDHCYENCFKQCPCPQPCNTTTSSLPPIIIPTPHPPQKSNQTIVVVNKPENHNPVNITTVVNLKNYINNKNVINTPINITNVNHNHINETQCCSENKGAPGILPPPQKCCIVVYPYHCYDIAVHPYRKCYEKREKKCGEICTSVVIHIVHVRDRPVPFPYPVPKLVHHPYPVPVIQKVPVLIRGPCIGTGCGTQCIGGGCGPQCVGGTCGNQCQVSGGCGYRRICHWINRHPWISCGHYGAQNCGSCYVCGGQYNPGFCSQQPGCPGLCRGNIAGFSSNFQNDILRYAPTYNTQSPDVQYPAAQPYQQQIDHQQQAYAAVQQPVDLGAQQQYVQQPADLGAQQQYMQQPADLAVQQQFAAMQQHQQQPVEFQQGGIPQQYVLQQPYEVQQPYGGQQQFGVVQNQFDGQQMQQMQQMMHQPVQMQEQPIGFGGK